MVLRRGVTRFGHTPLLFWTILGSIYFIFQITIQPTPALIHKTCRQSCQPLLRNSTFYSCVWGGTNRLIMIGVQTCKRACILYPYHIRLNSYLYCFSNTGIYSIGASTFTVHPPSNTSPVEVSFQLPSGKYTSLSN